MDMNGPSYSPPLALTVISGVFLAFGAVFALVIAFDILIRRGWKSMSKSRQQVSISQALTASLVWIMIPVYVVNATYLGPVALLVYFRYGRPPKPTSASAGQSHCHSQPAEPQPSGSTCHSKAVAKEKDGSDHEKPLAQSHSCHSWQVEGLSQSTSTDSSDLEASAEKNPSRASHGDCHATPQPASIPSCHNKQTELTSVEADAAHSHCHNKPARPMWATVLVGICHCGAGCVLGDVVGEWIVSSSGWRINGQSVWAELIMDYIWALAFGIIFQYFSIAPMSGEYGPKSVWRATKADFLSLTSFQIGLFGWMVAYQVGIFGYRLDMQTWTYWWLMQVGMVIGSVTAYPMNWVLITYQVKEPCA